MRYAKLAVCATAALALVVSGCSGSSSKSSDDKTGGTANYVTDGTFSWSVTDDPGPLNPLSGSRTVGVNLFRFLYDPLVHADSTGKIVSGIASAWTVKDNVVEFTIKTGVTCSDGSPITPSVIAKTFNQIKDPANASTLIGIALPDRDYTVVADDATNKFTLTLGKPYQFILPALEFMPIACGKAADNIKAIDGLATSGSGPYTLTKFTVGDSYTLTRRDGYTWGPGGAATSAPGVPKTLVMKVVTSETTAANLLTTGDLSAASIVGPDKARLTGAGFAQNTYTSGGALLLYNETAGRITNDPLVRKAIASAIDRDQIAAIVSQGLLKKAANSVAPASPQSCVDTAAADSIPKLDVAAAKKLLDQAGWVVGTGGVRSKGGKELNLTAPYLSTYAGNQPAAELMQKELADVGIKLTLSPVTQGTLSTQLFSTGDYDIWPTLALSIPFQSGIFGLLGGPNPPTGTNAGHVANATFVTAATDANQTVGKAGCDKWVTAEKSLFENADATPIAGVVTNWVTKNASFSVMQGRIMPATIRLTK
jgi:peptide/nickel transport system substrate-binding protein